MASTAVPGTTYVLLLRAVNVGGNNKIPMKDLKALVEESGCTDVSTYIQSGNVVCKSQRAADDLRAELEGRIKSRFDVNTTVMIRTGPAMKAIIDANPYRAEVADPTKVFVLFMADNVDPGALESIDRSKFAPEAFTANGREIYLHLPNGAGRAKLTSPLLERSLNMVGTARNWRTVTKLVDLAP